MSDAERCRYCGEPLPWPDFRDLCPTCSAEYVYCDEHCRALNDPETPDEIKATMIHYREHGSLGGCSHGR